MNRQVKFRQYYCEWKVSSEFGRNCVYNGYPCPYSSYLLRKLQTKKKLALHHDVARGRKPTISTPRRSEGVQILDVDSRHSLDFAPSTSGSVYEAEFDGYKQGIELTQGAPARMHSEFSEDSDGMDGEHLSIISSPYDEVKHNYLLSLGSTASTVGVSKFYSTYLPQRSRQQSRYQRSTNEDIIALLQSQQASLEKVCKGLGVRYNTHQ